MTLNYKNAVLLLTMMWLFVLSLTRAQDIISYGQYNFTTTPLPQRVGGGGRDVGGRQGLKERMNSMLLILQRINDRLVTLETFQSQQTQRIDNINYRITKLGMNGQEQKEQLVDLSTAVRHKVQQSDTDADNIHNQLEGLKESIDQLLILNNNIKDTIKGQETTQASPFPQIQGALAAVFGVKASIQTLKKEVQDITEGMESLLKNTITLSTSSKDIIKKQDLYASMADLKEELRMQKYQGGINLFADPNNINDVNKREARDCWEHLHKRGATQSGVYIIHPNLGEEPFFAFCDMHTDGGGWTVIQHRDGGTIEFSLGWQDYKNGFGNLAEEFWMGNQKIFHLTNFQVHEMLIDLHDFDQAQKRASYSAFAIASEKEGYALRLLGNYEGTAGDSLRYHVGQKWSTYDLDNDAWPNQNCARDHEGGWWYKACDTSNLNGRYLHGPVSEDYEYKGVYWYDFHGPLYSLWKTTMMIRRGGHVYNSTSNKMQQMKPRTAAQLNTNMKRTL